MWRNWLLRAAQLIGSVLGAMLLVSLLVVAARPPHGFWPFAGAVFERFLAAAGGDFGRSFVTDTPAMTGVLAVIPFSLELIAVGAMLAFLIGGPLGILLGASRTLRAASPLMQIVTAMPVFVVALGLIWIAARIFRWDEPALMGAVSWSDLRHPGGLSAALHAFALPALTVGAAGAASVQLSLRRAASTAWTAPYRSGLRMMGLNNFDISLHYLIPEIFVALLRDLGDIMLTLISATAVAEWVFHRDGVAVLFLKSAALGDWPVAGAALFVFALVTLGTGFLGTGLATFIAPEEPA
jgi:peptide/nickel transport system permease protein